MTPNFLHFHCSFEEASNALSVWCGRKLDAAKLGLECNENGWTTISIDLDYVATDDWLILARSFDFFYELYSTSLAMGEIVFCRDQKLVRHLLIDEDNADDQVDLGRLQSELTQPLETWSDIWGFVDDLLWEKEVCLAG